MKNNQLLIIALVLVTLGLMGLFTTSWFGRHQRIGGVPPMPGMMMDGMMGRDMMDRDQMKEMMQGMMPGMLPPGVKPESLPDPNSKGARLLVRYCTQCHNLPNPAMHSVKEWPMVSNRMFSRMSMMSGMMDIENPSSGEQQLIVTYLKAHAMNSISPDELPSPQSHGAILYKETCSQCHGLPDPKIHTGQEWAGVVERMRTNMQLMGKRMITADEKNVIVDYLMKHAKK